MSPEITITSEELRERVEDHLDRWIPDDVWNLSLIHISEPTRH